MNCGQSAADAGRGNTADASARAAVITERSRAARRRWHSLIDVPPSANGPRADRPGYAPTGQGITVRAEGQDPVACSREGEALLESLLEEKRQRGGWGFHQA